MEITETIGYAASGLSFSAFCMRTMMPLRYVAICANVATMAYGYLASLYPVLALHTLLLPLNIYRLYEIRKLITDVRAAAQTDLNVDWLLPYMTRRTYRAGETLFERGDRANEMFYISSGTIRLREIQTDRGPGALLGEIGLFSPHRARMYSADCLSDVEAWALSDAQVMNMVYQNRAFGFYLIQLITSRLVQDVYRLDHELRDHRTNLQASDPPRS